MAEDVSGQEAFADALSGGGGGEIAGTVDADVLAGQGAQETSQEAAPGGQAAPDGAQQPEGQEAPQQAQDRAREEAMVPSWRLREINEQREAERRQWQQDQRELAEMRRWRQEQEEERKRAEDAEKLKTTEFDWENPNRFVDDRLQHGVRDALTPIQREIQQLRAERQQEREESSRERAEEKYGKDVVVAAWNRAHQAILSGDPEALALKASLEKSRHPYGDLVAFDKRRSTLEAIGGDLDSYTKKQREEALKDPEFLARALEAHRSLATPVQTGVPGRAPQPQQNRGLPSLNRQTSAQDQGAESDDPNAVFHEALSAPRPRPR